MSRFDFCGDCLQGSAVTLNGHALGNTTNQHLRYTFEIAALLAKSGGGENSLEISFVRDIANSGRFMACSGGWDWAPYSRMRDVEGNPMLTRGIWKSVYLAATSSNAAVIESMTPTILFKGEPPMAVLKDDGSHAFEVNVTAYLTAKQASGTLHVSGAWGAFKSVAVKLTAADHGRKAVSVLLEASGVKLWWPRGLGPQTMYNISAVFEPSASTDEGEDGRVGVAAGSVTAQRRVGFRVAYLTTGNDTDASWVAAHRHGNGNAVPAHTVMFRINGAAMSMRGANMIPMETLEGRYVPGMHRALVKSAAAANMNLLRIWGGGVYIYEEFTDACDEEGVMVYEDMMFGTDGIMPGAANTSDQEAELRYQIRRQAHHPAIIGWCGCNECGGHGVYTNFVMETVASEDNSRVIRSSSPFGLYSSGVNTITGLPNGQKLIDIPLSAEKPKDGSPWPAGAEQHGPYQHGGIFPAINAGGKFIDKPPLVVGVQPGHAVGPTEPGYAKTETGCSSLSSFESMAATLKPSEYGIHTDPFHERNYPGDPLILSYFGLKAADLDVVGVESFQRQLYLNMLGAGLQRKANIESWRSTNIWAMLMWQLNEIWPTGGW
jgi:beta-mannosidase